MELLTKYGETAERAAVSHLNWFTFATLEGVFMVLKSFRTACIPSGHLFMQDVFIVSGVNEVSLYKYLQHYAVS